MAEFTIDDMINAVLEKQPETFRDAFSSIMQAKVADAVEYKKVELAQSIYDDETSDTDDEDYDVSDEDTDEEEYDVSDEEDNLEQEDSEE